MFDVGRWTGNRGVGSPAEPLLVSFVQSNVERIALQHIHGMHHTDATACSPQPRADLHQASLDCRSRPRMRRRRRCARASPRARIPRCPVAGGCKYRRRRSTDRHRRAGRARYPGRRPASREAAHSRAGRAADGTVGRMRLARAAEPRSGGGSPAVADARNGATTSLTSRAAAATRAARSAYSGSSASKCL